MMMIQQKTICCKFVEDLDEIPVMTFQKPRLVIVIPCFNEAGTLPETAKTLSEKIGSLISGEHISSGSCLLFVDDGSTDNTWSLIENLHQENPLVFSGIKLSGNRGQQNALLCGLLSAQDYADAIITIDADLQDDVDAIDKMLMSFLDGSQIVFGVRSNRKNDSFFKRTSAHFFYRFMEFLGAGTMKDHADFRLMGKKALQALAGYSEENLFLRGIVAQLGFKTGIVYYQRKKRPVGSSKYSLRKMFNFALDGITSFSVRPLRCIGLLGSVLFLVSLIMSFYFAIMHFSGNKPGPWTFLLCSVWGIGGLVIFSLGIAGEYIGKIYMEAKHRPRYHIEQLLFRQESIHEA